METSARSYRDLKVWQLGIQLVKDIYILSEKFPKHELYGVIGQIRRSAVSIPSNIAEGFRRYHNKEYAHFLRISLGSCAELETLVAISKELGYINSDEETIMMQKFDMASGMLMNLLKKVSAKVKAT